MAETRATTAVRRLIAVVGKVPGHALRAGMAVTVVLVLAACAADEPSPQIPEDAVRIPQGTNPRIEGLSVGLASVSGDEARMSVFGHAEEVERISGRPGDRFELGDYRLEVIDVGEGDDGYATIVVTPPDDA